MAIYKARLDSNYVIISNKTAQDNRLSFEARGVLAMLLSMPDDWSVNVAWIQKQSKAGRDKVNRIINELIKCGYMRKDQPRNQQGKFTSQDYFVYPEPYTAEEMPANGFPVNGSPVNGKTDTTKETTLQIKQETNNVRPDGLTDSQIKEITKKGFEHFWSTWLGCKKKMGVKNISAKGETYEKRWIKLFGKSFWDKSDKSDFESQVNAICAYAETIHDPDDNFCPAKNMMTGKFFTRQGWKDE